MTDDHAGGLDEPEELQPEQGSLRLAAPEDDWSRADWERAAAAVLRKAHRLGEEDADAAVWDALAHPTYDDLVVPPLGTPHLLAEQRTSGRPGRHGPWDVRPYAAAGPAELVNRELLDDLEGGASSLWVELADGADLGELLHGVRLDLAGVVIEAPSRPETAARALLDLAGDTALHPATNLGVDAADSTPELAHLVCEAGVLGFVVDATRVHGAGASDAQELGWAIAALAAYLRRMEDAGVALPDAARAVELRLAATDQQLPTLAKLRAVRRLWARVLELSGCDDLPLRVHAVTSAPMLSRSDPWVNMLRGTVAAFAAGVGGADAVTVLPFDSRLGRPDAFGRRIARNVSHLLVAESHVAAVADPAGGAYAVERLTDDLAVAAWAELGRIETDGADAFDQRVRDVAARRRDDVAHRRLPLTGVSEYPSLAETLPERSGEPDLPPSYGDDFERMRLAPVDARVFLATLGSVAQHTARAGFATNLLAAGGVGVDLAGATSSVADVTAAYAGQTVVCLAGTDTAYAEWGSEAAARLREAGAERVLVAGISTGSTDAFDWADDSCARGGDAVAFLTRTREALR
jgi:methylmalonyl-CoA mutase